MRMTVVAVEMKLVGGSLVIDKAYKGEGRTFGRDAPETGLSHRRAGVIWPRFQAFLNFDIAFY